MNEAMAMLPGALGHPTAMGWQTRLLAAFIDGDLPTALDLPTGLGKTSVMAIWLLARLVGARVPRRLVYVVDRRAVVDQATEEAVRLRDWVKGAGLADALGVKDALPISTLRGQFADNRAWLEDPASPAIVIGTVDMVGSRLLFQGYGCSPKMRPYHAAMLACDTLLVLDESHLVPPFQHLVSAIARRDWWPAADLGTQPIRLLTLSATAADTDGAFALQPSDLQEPVVARRVHAAKHLVVQNLGTGANLPELLADEAWRLVSTSSAPVRVVVFCQRRRDAEVARKGFDKLSKGAECDSALFTGGRRVRERSRARDKLKELGFLAAGIRPDKSAVLFATSAAEVGVDLDADHMVGDIVPWERMVQRLGRVNRRGVDGSGAARDAQVSLVLDPSIPLAEASAALISDLPVSAAGRDGSPAALMRLRDDPATADRVRAASTPAPLRPGLSRALLDAWSMTSLPDHTGRPEVAPWLRGWIDDEPQCRLVWREHLPPAEWLAPYFEAAPPHLTEVLEVPASYAADWLRKRVRRLLAAATRQARADEDDAKAFAADAVAVVILDHRGAVGRTLSLGALSDLDSKQTARVLAAHTVVLDRRVAGLSEAGLLDDREDNSPEVADACGPGNVWLESRDDAGTPVLRFRVRTVRGDQSPDADWRPTLHIPTKREGNEITEWLVVERWWADTSTEDSRSTASQPQRLSEHQEDVRTTVEGLAASLGLPTPAIRVLSIAARLHDEGKRASRWQQAFHAPAGGPWAKTRGPVNTAVLGGYRHELGSLPYALADDELQALDPDERALALHLIAAHHGFARPVIRPDGCEDVPPSVAEGRAREVALRFIAQQERWGPWGLAWWETLLRAADQQASRANDQRGRK